MGRVKGPLLWDIMLWFKHTRVYTPFLLLPCFRASDMSDFWSLNWLHITFSYFLWKKVKGSKFYLIHACLYSILYNSLFMSNIKVVGLFPALIILPPPPSNTLFSKDKCSEKRFWKIWKSHEVLKKWLEILKSPLFQTLNNYRIIFHFYTNIIEKFTIQKIIVKKSFSL